MVFRITGQGDLTVVASFGTFDGVSGLPLVQAADGTFYGTMESGETGKGSVFRMTPDGVVSTVFAFADDHIVGMKAIMQARDGDLYGVTEHGGPNQLGTVFRVTTAGVLTTIHTFSGGLGGSRPIGRMVQAADGHLYGTTAGGGAAGFGTIFRITRSGALTTLHSFAASDGRPLSPLSVGSDGLVYGTTSNSINEGLLLGSVFRVSPVTAAVTTLHSFPIDESEGVPGESGVVEGPDGEIYGTTRMQSQIPGGKQGTFYRLSSGRAVVR